VSLRVHGKTPSSRTQKENIIMLDIEEMESKEIQDLLQQVGYVHLGCAGEGHPYVVPMHYYLEDSDIYLFTTEGMKTKYIVPEQVTTNPIGQI
jgi:hypothetical protein